MKRTDGRERSKTIVTARRPGQRANESRVAARYTNNVATPVATRRTASQRLTAPRCWHYRERVLRPSPRCRCDGPIPSERPPRQHDAVAGSAVQLNTSGEELATAQLRAHGILLYSTKRAARTGTTAAAAATAPPSSSNTM